MSDLEPDPRPLHAAGVVRAARRTIDEAIAVLAARPLDEAAAEQMRVAIGPVAGQAREALVQLRELDAAVRPDRRLRVVSTDAGGAPHVERDAPPARRGTRRPRPGGVR